MENVNQPVNNEILRPASINLLYDGMVVDDDIYDSSGDKMLVTAGNVLTDDLIERMKRLNGGSDAIRVSGRTAQAMLSKKPNIEYIRREELEHSSGYAAALGNLSGLFQEVGDTKKIHRVHFYDLAGDVSKFLKATPQESAVMLICAISPVEEYLERHMLNVALLNGLIGQWLNMSEEEIDKLILIGLIHDCGHALLPPKILHSDHKYTKLDYEAVKMHTVRTEELLSGFTDDIRIAAVYHHERLDGSGYPKGLPAKAIVPAARITAASDIFEAVVNARAYRPPRSPFCALSMLDKMSPDQIDKDVAGALVANIPGHFTDKPFTMSDGTIGIVRSLNPGNIEYPAVEVGRKETATSEKLCPVSLYTE